MTVVLIPTSTSTAYKHPLTVPLANFCQFEPRLGVTATTPSVQPTVLDEAPFALTEAAINQAIARQQWPLLLPMPMGLSWGAVRALWKQHPHLTVVYCSAHVPSPVSDPYGDRSWLAQAQQHAIPVIHVGGRHGTAQAWQSIKTLFAPHTAWTVAEFLAAIPRTPIFLGIDASVLDPSLVAVPAPEPGGLDWERLITLCNALISEHQVVGAAIGGLALDAPDLSIRVMARLINWLIACRELTTEKQSLPK